MTSSGRKGSWAGSPSNVLLHLRSPSAYSLDLNEHAAVFLILMLARSRAEQRNQISGLTSSMAVRHKYDNGSMIIRPNYAHAASPLYCFLLHSRREGGRPKKRGEPWCSVLYCFGLGRSRAGLVSASWKPREASTLIVSGRARPIEGFALRCFSLINTV